MQDTEPAVDVILDAGRAGCADLLLLVVKEMQAMQPGQVLHVFTYDPGAHEDLPAWCRMTQNTLLHQIIVSGTNHPSHFYIRKKGTTPHEQTAGKPEFRCGESG